jgi:hypothetical protein
MPFVCSSISCGSLRRCLPLLWVRCWCRRYSQIKLSEVRQAASAKLNLPQAVPMDDGGWCSCCLGGGWVGAGCQAAGRLLVNS